MKKVSAQTTSNRKKKPSNPSVSLKRKVTRKRATQRFAAFATATRKVASSRIAVKTKSPNYKDLSPSDAPLAEVVPVSPPRISSRSAETDFPIIAIGASAGGLQAIEEFLASVPSNPGAAFVVIQHLSPDFKSFMPEILSKKTNLDVLTATNQLTLSPNTIYLLPPKKNLIYTNRCLYLSDIERNSIPNKPIDLFFHSLAQNRGQGSVAVILSGTGTDGSLGIQTINEAGGRVFVESPESASFDGMPNAAIATNAVDNIGTPGEIASLIFGASANRDAQALDLPLPPQTEAPRAAIFRKIESIYGVDFSKYKATTIDRRMDKRIQALGLNNVDAYLNYLRSTPEEISKLYYDTLIGVTRFFRDEEAFDILKQHIQTLVAQKSAKDMLRVWVPGCASGEEAYSIAILLAEAIRISQKDVDFKIFATDVDDEILTTATRGDFSAEQVAPISPSLLGRYFSEATLGYHASTKIRSKIVFARHNVLTDPPFTKVDLVSCRNLLIYLDSDAQKTALELFYFSLVPEGLLFLGPSETLGKLNKGFQTQSTKWKLFQKHPPPSLSVQPTVSIERYRSRPALPHSTSTVLPRAPAPTSQRLMDNALTGLLEEFVPPSILIDEQLNLLHVYGEIPFRPQFKSGTAANNLQSFIDDRLCTAISVALQRAKREQKKVVYHQFSLQEPESEEQFVDFWVKPVASHKDEHVHHFLVSINRSELKVEASETVVIEAPSDFSQLSILKEELQNTKENLQATIEELEVTNEELHSTNEELLASNEELQSTNEELQSVNEELYTVNAEHQERIIQLTQLTLDEKNFFESTGIAMVYLDSEFRVRKFTPAAAQLFNLLEHDVGRPFNHFRHNFEDFRFSEVFQTVVSKKKHILKELETLDGTAYAARFMPYIDEDRAVDGVTVTLLDVSPIKAATKAREEAAKRFELATVGASVGIFDWEDVEHDNIYISNKYLSLLGYEPNEIKLTFSQFKERIHPEDVEATLENINAAITSTELHDIEYRLKTKSDTFKWFHGTGVVSQTSNHNSKRMIGSIRDISDRKAHETEIQKTTADLRRMTERYNLAVDGVGVGVWSWDVNTNQNFWSDQFYKQLNFSPGEIEASYEAWKSRIHPEDLASVEAALQSHLEQKLPYRLEFRLRAKEGDYRWYKVSGQANFDADNQPTFMAGSLEDIQDLKLAHEQLIRQKDDLAVLAERLSAALSAARVGIWEMTSEDESNDQVWWSDTMERVLKLDFSSPDQSFKNLVETIHPDDHPKVMAGRTALLQTGDPLKEQVRVRIHGGDYHWFEIGAHRVQTGQNARIIGTLLDIHTLSQQAMTLDNVLKHIPSYIFWKDCDLVYQGCNESFAEMVGLNNKTQVVGKTDFDFKRDAKHAQSYREWDAKVIESGQPMLDTQEPYPHPDGSTGYVLTSKVPFRDAVGNINGLLGISTDITPRVRLEQELQATYESFPDAYMVCASEDGRILECNPAAESMFAARRGELLGRNLFDLSPDTQWDNRSSEEYGAELIETVIAHGRSRAEWLHKRLDGEVFHCDVNITVLNRGSQSVYLVSLRDVTARRQLEAELEYSNQELAQFASVVSHDLQAPLRTITSYISLLLQEIFSDHQNQDEKLNQWAAFIQDASDDMKLLIRDFIDYARFGQNGAHREHLDLNQVVEKVIHNLSSDIEETGAQVEVASLPMITANSKNIHRVFQNIIENAIKYRAEDRPLHIHIHSTSDVLNHTVIIDDNGTGIAEEHTQRVFKIFQRINTQSSGTGIGLAIVQKAIQQLGGDVWVESAPGQGSSFRFTVPISTLKA